MRVQNGAVVLLILLIILLGASTWMLSDWREQKTVSLIADQRQTARVLVQAKEALIGFAATYAESHEGQLSGYLPCPDYDGDGDADAGCSNRGLSVIGRFPWKTVGLPPLRDGSGECLWYAVSGNFKDDPKSKITAAAPKVKTLTSDDGGLFLIKDAQGNYITGVADNNRAIAVIFAPGQQLSGQNRMDLGTETEMTECGSQLVVVDDVGDASYPTLNPVNNVTNYLDRYVNGAIKIHNATGCDEANGTCSSTVYDFANDTSCDTSTLANSPPLRFRPSHDCTGENGFFAADNDPTDNSTLATFIKAPWTRDVNGNMMFNDSLAIITVEDFAGVYQLMNLSIAKRVAQCLSSYSGWQQYKGFFETKYGNAIGSVESPDISTYRATYTTQIEEYVTDKLAECALTDCLSSCIEKCEEDADCITECKNEQEEHYRRTALNYTKKYPWPADISDVDDGEYTDTPGIRLGRISDVFSGNSDEMLDTWPLVGGKQCFDETPTNFENYEWSWWDEWKERVFYATDDDYTPDTIYFWVKAAKKSTETSAEFNLRNQTLKENTFAKIADPTKAPADVLATDWSLETIPTAGAQILRLDDNGTMKNSSFLVFVAGSKLASQSRQLSDDKKDITNYLEDNNASTGDDLFERKSPTLNFNDLVCRNDNTDCGILY